MTAGIVLVLSLLACGKKEDPSATPPTTPPTTTPPPTTPTTPTAVPEPPRPSVKAFSLEGGKIPSGAFGFSGATGTAQPAAAGTGPATCDTAAARIVSVLFAMASEEERATYTGRQGELTAQFSAACRSEAWPPASIACATTASDGAALQACVDAAGGTAAAAPASTPPSELPAGTCAAVCAKRETCLHKSDRGACVSACTTAQLNAQHLTEYGAMDCAGFEQKEPDHLLLRQMVRTCQHLIDCGVKGAMATCLGVVIRNLSTKAYGAAQLATWEAQDCPTIVRTVVIDTPTPSAPAAPVGRSCRQIHCGIEGPAGDAICQKAGCGPCFFGGCNTF